MGDSREKLEQMVCSADYRERAKAARQGFGLERLVADEDCFVRMYVARQGYGLDVLVNDVEEFVRGEVALQGYGLDKLIEDPSDLVRACVAEAGYGLDVLIHDNDENVRASVAERGFGLEKLVDDESEVVRAAVASRGYALDRLVKDDGFLVKWEVAKQGYGLEVLVNDEFEEVREKAREMLGIVRENVRMAIAEFAGDGQWLDCDDLEELGKQRPDLEKAIDYYLHGQCEEWVLENFQPGDIAIIWNEFDNDIGKVALVHCYIQRGNVFVDVRGETEDEELVEDGFDCGLDYGKIACGKLEDFKEWIRKICGYEDEKWAVAHKVQAVVDEVLRDAKERAADMGPCDGLSKDSFERE